MNRAAQRGIDINLVEEAINRSAGFLETIQNEDGSWTGDYGGTVFLIPMYVIAMYLMNQEQDQKEKDEFTRYLASILNDDGSIGLHPEDEGRMFTSVLCYVALRIMDMEKNHPMAAGLREWIQSHGTALETASWGKFFLRIMNLYPRKGLNPLLPELMLLPYSLPIHPGRLWCHARQVYIPMAWVYGKGIEAPETEFIRELRSEIYDKPYEKIPFGRYMNRVAETDTYTPISSIMKVANRAMYIFDRLVPRFIRKKALDVTYEHIMAEERNTNFIAIGPVNRILNTVAHYFIDKDSEATKKSLETIKLYLFQGEDGLKYNGYNSTALWDTAFALQALHYAKVPDSFSSMIAKAHTYVRDNQVLEDVPEKEKYFRHASRGGWPFSNRDHGWPITDCTAEGLKASINSEDDYKTLEPVPPELKEAAVELILSFQNNDGSWSTYERRRGPYWLEKLNPASVFGNIMVDYPFIECSSSCVEALVQAKKEGIGPQEKIDRSLKEGIEFLKSAQRPDGSFYGQWAVCFTYGTWFGVSALVEAGIDTTDSSIIRAVAFLEQHQNDDGGWGESYESSRQEKWIYHEKSQVVQTAWALMTLVNAGRAQSESVKKGIGFLLDTQLDNGDWPRESLVGIFNKTSIINYENYRRYFPLWALGLYRNRMSL